MTELKKITKDTEYVVRSVTTKLPLTLPQRRSLYVKKRRSTSIH